MNLAINRFKKGRKGQWQALKRAYARLTVANRPISLETIKEIIKTAENDEKFTSGLGKPLLLSDAGNVTKARAYIFALQAGHRNSDYFSASALVAGLSRFGVESPYPVISTRCGLYGNVRSVK